MQGCGVFPSECYGLLEGNVLIAPATVATSRVDESDKISVVKYKQHVLTCKLTTTTHRNKPFITVCNIVTILQFVFIL